MRTKMTDELVKRVFPKRDADANKGDFGYIALVGGSLPYSGAIRLAAMANAAMRSGAGVCTVAAPRSICSAILPQILESTLYPLSETDGFLRFDEAEFAGLVKRYDVIAFGMGVGNTPETEKAVRYLLGAYGGILVLDADGLNALASILREEAGKRLLRETAARVVITPHLKEFSRLTGMTVDAIRNDPENSAAAFSREYGCITLLKGKITRIANETAVIESDTGTPGMATAGSGDVLSGILAAVLAQNRFPAEPQSAEESGEAADGETTPASMKQNRAEERERLLLATAAAAYVNGRAGELAASEHGEISMTAGDTARSVEEAIRSILKRETR